MPGKFVRGQLAYIKTTWGPWWSTHSDHLPHTKIEITAKPKREPLITIAHRTAGGVTGDGVGGLCSWEGGGNSRGSDRDGNVGSAYFDSVIDSSDEWSQVGVLHVAGEVEWCNPRNRAREVLRRGEVITLCIDDDNVTIVALEGEARKIDRVRALTCVVQY